MASKLKVNEFTTTSGSGSVSFPNCGANFNGDVTVSGNLNLDTLGGAITVKSYSQSGKPSNPPAGTVIWNTDFFRIEIWNGFVWTRLDQPGGLFPTTGLVVHLDATDTSSYNGGTTWTDLSGSNNNFTINANAFQGSTGNKTAYMSFINDTNGCAKNSSDISLSGEVTYVCATRILNSTSTWRTLTRSYSSDHHVIIQSGGWSIGMYDNNSVGFRDSGADQNNLSGYNSNSFMVMIWRFSDTDDPTYEFIVNGEVLGTIRDSNARYNRGFGSLGAYHDGSTNPTSSSQYWGDIRMFAAYSRRISNTEVCDITNSLISRGYLQ
tara:strand:+ start:2451 stop:3416 length:966 start_codon:yes stop_codon:yes gene_type:complete